MLSGGMDTAGIAEVLHYLRRKGETVAELVGFASAMQEMAHPIELAQDDDPVIDTCGTGGDGANTFNVSTATAFVVAGAGQRVAKHGNRRISSQCGSADVLGGSRHPGVFARRAGGECIRETGIGFLYAPLLHPAVKHAQEARLMLKGRTVFNLLGPLTNPVRARASTPRCIFCFAPRNSWRRLCRVLGIDRAFVVHGADGLDEITTTAPTTVFQVEEGSVQKGRWQPSDFGLPEASLDELQGGDTETNARIIRGILEGEPGPKRDLVVANAAAALFVARKAIDLKSAVAMAAESIDSGAARRKLEKLIEFSVRLQHEVAS